MEFKGVYKASRKSVNEKTGKGYWNPVGFTVFVGEYKGDPSVTLIDERTGERYPCFPPRAKEGSGGASSSGYDEGANGTDDGGESNVPF